MASLGRQIKECKAAMQKAATYNEWYLAAAEMDVLRGHEAWKHEDESEDYNYRLLRQRTRQLKRYRQNQDVEQLVYFLNESLHRNLGNITNAALYHVAHTGTKSLIVEYINEVCRSLNWLCDIELPDFNHSEKLRFFKQTGQSYGRSAIMLSGGATLGLFHTGVLKTLHGQGLLPRVISGSSAGAIMAGIVGTRSDEEVPTLFDVGSFNLDPFRWMSPSEMLRDHAVLDSQHLLRCLEENIGDYTFGEAFEKTGRVINITASPTRANQMPRLLNYLTAPHVLISRAVLASCSIPGMFAPASLMAKDKNGRHVPYMPTLKWVDGSMRSDLPARRLSRLHNVNHYIVSQTNPHVVPFISDHERKRGILPFASQLAKATIRAQANEVMTATHRHVNSLAMRRVIEEVRGITEQSYKGDITLSPSLSVMKYVKLLRNPTDTDLEAFMLEGERATWPMIEQIRVTTQVAQAFEDCIDRLKHSRERRETDRRHLRVV